MQRGIQSFLPIPIRLHILGDKTLYDSIAAYLEGVLGNPTNKDDYGQAWNLERTVDDKDYEGSVFMIFDNSDPAHNAIYINCVLGMKQNYKTCRTLLHDNTGIWLPESQAAQILETSEITKGDTRVQFNIDLAYDATLFSGIVSALKAALPKDPLMDVEDIALWEYLLDKDGSAKESPSGESANTAAKINWQVEKSTDEKTNPIISFLFLQRNYFTVSLVAQTGGSVQMMASGKPVEGNTFIGTDDWNLELTATPEEGYVFTGWYRDDRKIASNSTYNYSPRGDETITPASKAERSIWTSPPETLSSTMSRLKSQVERKSLTMSHFTLKREKLWVSWELQAAGRAQSQTLQCAFWIRLPAA